jgi:hypothetical protein
MSIIRHPSPSRKLLVVFEKNLAATVTNSKTIPPETFLPQKALIFKEMQPIHIWMFIVGLIGSKSFFP